MEIPYFTFPKTYLKKSYIKKAGYGLFTESYIQPFEWIGFYPGIIDFRKNFTSDSEYLMGTIEPSIVISADKNKNKGVHLINEANNEYPANVWYVKLKNKCCLYFASRQIYPNEELITCYSNTYGKRKYPIARNCTDPRCARSLKKHRNHSLLINNWRMKLLKKQPKYLKGKFL